MKLANQLRKFIKASGKTQYQIAKESGVTTASLGRFMRKERGLHLSVAEKLVEHLGLELKKKRR